MAYYPPYERPTFDPINLTDLHEPVALKEALNNAFEEYRAFTERLLADQQTWVVAVREKEDSQLPSGEFAEFESEPCMNASPLESIMECIEAETFPLFIYLTDAAVHACAQNQRFDEIPDVFGEEVMALTTPPYGWTPANPTRIRKEYHKRGYDGVTRGHLKHFVAVVRTDWFAQEDDAVWTRSKTGRFDIVAYGRVSFKAMQRGIRTRSRC